MDVNKQDFDKAYKILMNIFEKATGVGPLGATHSIKLHSFLKTGSMGLISLYHPKHQRQLGMTVQLFES